MFFFDKKSVEVFVFYTMDLRKFDKFDFYELENSFRSDEYFICLFVFSFHHKLLFLYKILASYIFHCELNIIIIKTAIIIIMIMLVYFMPSNNSHSCSKLCGWMLGYFPYSVKVYFVHIVCSIYIFSVDLLLLLFNYLRDISYFLYKRYPTVECLYFCILSVIMTK